MDITTTPATTENLSDIIDPTMARGITANLDYGMSLSGSILRIPTTAYRRERMSTWIREMGRTAAIDALHAYAKSNAIKEIEVIDDDLIHEPFNTAGIPLGATLTDCNDDVWVLVGRSAEGEAVWEHGGEQSDLNNLFGEGRAPFRLNWWAAPGQPSTPPNPGRGTVTDVNITITVDAPGGTAHVCGGMCDCPKAITRAQNAIDADRAEHDVPARGLSERLHGMRNGAPGPDWFDAMAQQAETLEARAAAADNPASGALAAWAARCDASDAATPAQRFAALDATIETTVMDLARAELLPPDHLSDVDLDAHQSLVFIDNELFTATLHEPDAPAARYRVTTSTRDDNGPSSERITADLNEVRAWLLAWCVATTR